MSGTDGWLDGLQRLAARLGCAAPPPELAAALTHPSYVHAHPGSGPHYERLEFLGDAAVNLLAAEQLYARWPAADEGELSRRRAGLVCRAALAALAERLALQPCLRLGRAEARAPSRRVLAAALEAVAGALFVAGGMAAVRRALGAPLAELAAAEAGAGAPGDAKSRLQEACHRLARGPPSYRLVEVRGPAHAARFTCEVWVDEVALGRAAGGRRKEAEQKCAEQALAALLAKASGA